jgi:hypothetical protein
MPRRILGPSAQWWRRMIAMTLPRERALASRMATELRRVAATAAEDVLEGREPSLSAHESRVRGLLVAAYHDTMPTLGRAVLDAAAGKRARSSFFEQLVLQWIEEAAARKVTAVTNTTRAQLRRSIGAARSEGEGTAGVARRIREDVGGVIATARSHVIARTETHAAANAAQHFAAESLQRDDMSREWIAAEDERTRADHAAANGQVVALEQPFTVGGELLMYPGDMGGSAAQVINCRCTTGFIVS